MRWQFVAAGVVRTGNLYTPEFRMWRRVSIRAGLSAGWNYNLTLK